MSLAGIKLVSEYGDFVDMHSFCGYAVCRYQSIHSIREARAWE